MSEWVERRLSTIVDIISGGTPKTEVSDYWNGDIYWLAVNDFSGDNRWVHKSEKTITQIGLNNSATKILNIGDLIISARGTVGELAQIGTPMAFNQSCYGLRGKEGYNNDFLYYVLKQQLGQLKSVANGAVFDTIILKTFDHIKLTIPSLSTQTRIADILSAYDDTIENNNRRITLLEKAARELYREWFVRFRFPGYKKAKFVNGLPEGWKVASFGTLANIIDGDRGINYPKQEEFLTEGYCLFLNAGNVTKDGFDFSSNAFITEVKDRILRKGRLIHNDIVLTTRGTVGNIAFYNKQIPYHVLRINSGMVILRDSGVVSPEFLYITLRNDSVQKMIELYSSGSAQPQLPIKDMRKMKILKPTNELLSKFTDIVSDTLDQSALLQTQSQNLARQRDLLLPRLMSGKLDV